MQAQMIIDEGSTVRSVYDSNGVSLADRTSMGSGTRRSFATPYAVSIQPEERKTNRGGGPRHVSVGKIRNQHNNAHNLP